MEPVDIKHIVDARDTAMYDEIVMKRIADCLNGHLHSGPKTYYWPADWQKNVMYYMAEQLADLSKRIIAGHHHLEEMGDTVYEYKGLHDSLMARPETRKEIDAYIKKIPHHQRGFLRYMHYGKLHNMANQFVRAFRHLRRQEMFTIVKAYVAWMNAEHAQKTHREKEAEGIVEQCLATAAADDTFDEVHRDLFRCLCKPHMIRALHNGLKILEGYVVLLEWTSEWKNMLLLWKHPCGPLKLLRTPDHAGFLPLYRCELDDPFEKTPRYLHLSRMFVGNGQVNKRISQQANNTMSYLTASDCHLMILEAWFRPIVSLKYPTESTPEELKSVLKVSKDDIAAMKNDEKILYDMWTRSQTAYEARHPDEYKDPVMVLQPPQRHVPKLNHAGARGYDLFQVPTADGKFVTTVQDDGEITREWRHGSDKQIRDMTALDAAISELRSNIEEYRTSIRDCIRKKATNQLFHDKQLPKDVKAPANLFENLPEAVTKMIQKYFGGRLPNLDEWAYMDNEGLANIVTEMSWWQDALVDSVHRALEACENNAEFATKVNDLVARDDELEEIMDDIRNNLNDESDEQQSRRLRKQYSDAEAQQIKLFAYPQQKLDDDIYAYEGLIDDTEAEIEQLMKRRERRWERMLQDQPTDNQVEQEPLKKEIAQLEEKLKYLENALINKKQEAVDVTNQRVEKLLKGRLLPPKFKRRHQKLWEALGPFFQQVLESQKRLHELEVQVDSLSKKNKQKHRSAEETKLLKALDDEIYVRRSELEELKKELVLEAEQLMENDVKKLTHILQEIQQIEQNLARQKATNNASLPPLKTDLEKLVEEQEKKAAESTNWADLVDAEEENNAEAEQEEAGAEQDQTTKPKKETTAERMVRWNAAERARQAQEKANRTLNQGHRNNRSDIQNANPVVQMTIQGARRRAGGKTVSKLSDLPAFNTILNNRIGRHSLESTNYEYLKSEEERTEKHAAQLNNQIRHWQIIIQNYEIEKQKLGGSRPPNEIEAAQKYAEAREKVTAAQASISKLKSDITNNQRAQPKGKRADPNSMISKSIAKFRKRIADIENTLPNLDEEERAALLILTEIQKSSKRKEYVDNYSSSLNDLDVDFEQKAEKSIDEAREYYKVLLGKLKEANIDIERKKASKESMATRIVLKSVHEWNLARNYVDRDGGGPGSGRPGLGYSGPGSDMFRNDDYDDVQDYLNAMTDAERIQEGIDLHQYQKEEDIDEELRNEGLTDEQRAQWWADWQDRLEAGAGDEPEDAGNNDDRNTEDRRQRAAKGAWGDYKPGLQGQGRGEQRARGQDKGGGVGV